jgi:DNA polymerase III delta subunit
MTTSPLAYAWGDDDLALGRAVDRLAAALAAEGGAPLERWDLRGEMANAATHLALLHERIATSVMFGGGTLAVVSNVGALMRTTVGRDAMLAAVGLLASGNAMVILDVTKSGARGPSQKRLSEAIKVAGGAITDHSSPKGGSLAGWIEREARGRGMALEPGAAREIALRVGGFVDENDAVRQFQTRNASMELDKLALYRDSNPISVDDVRALVPEAVPGSIWGFVDAVGERRTGQALALLERLLASTPEPVLVVVLHRRVRELLELGDRLAGGAKLATAGRAMGINSEYRAQMIAAQARNWTTDELAAALDGLVELDALVKGAPGTSADAAQRRLAFTLWVMDHTMHRERRTA